MRDNVIPLGPRRVVEHEDCRGWTPRELLMDLVAKIDGDPAFKPDSILVVYTKFVGEATVTGMLRSKASLLQTIGMIETAKHDLLEQVL